MKDYYKILQVERTASAEEIKKSFRKLAKKFHPDVNPNHKQAEVVFKELNEAYAILGDEEKKKEYDKRLLGAGEQREEGFSRKRQRTRQTTRQTKDIHEEFGNAGSIFESFFGFSPQGTEVHMNQKDSVRPMKTSEAYAHIFGQGRFR